MSEMRKMSAKELCEMLIKKHLAVYMTFITSWNQFMESLMKGFIEEDVPHWKLLRAMAYGKKQGWLEARWWRVGFVGLRMPTRQRSYIITEKAKRELTKIESEKK